jgi:hypothetical protein
VFLLKIYPMSMVAQTIRVKEYVFSKILPNFCAWPLVFSSPFAQSFGVSIAIFPDWIKHAA